MSMDRTPLGFEGRIYVLAAVITLGFVVVLGGYYRVQVLNQERYEALGEKYRIKKTRYKATRGLIYDRHGKLITQNMPTYNLVLQRDEMNRSWRRFKPELSEFIGISLEELDKRYKKRSVLFSMPVTLKQDIGYAESLRIMRHRLRYPGLNIETADRRFYPHQDLFAHVLGYVGEASKKELQRRKKLRLGDMVGKSGMELRYDDLLLGEDGEQTIQIDSRGVYRNVELSAAPSPGSDLHLTLDLELQNLAVEALEGHAGSIVMMDVNTGDILVYVSAPSFDLNLFTGGISHENWDALLNSPERPFLNRPIQGAYAPGSVFKLVTILSALKHNKISYNTRYFCNGKAKFYDREFRCHKEIGHGWVDLTEAIQTSCNVFFYNIGNQIDANDLAQSAVDFGFGAKTGIDLKSEKPGLVPTPKWKKEHFKQIWFPGDTLNTTIGQGNLLATPIQIVQLMSVLANEGRMVRPRLLLKTIENNTENHIEPDTHEIPGYLPEYFSAVKDAMWKVVNEPNGTGSKAAVSGFDVCGKTGTAQLITFRKEEDHENDSYKNAWFAGFAPKRDARVAIMVLVEKAGAGGAAAAPIAKKLLEAYRKRLSSEDPT